MWRDYRIAGLMHDERLEEKSEDAIETMIPVRAAEAARREEEGAKKDEEEREQERMEEGDGGGGNGE
eukprot:705716-Hanusia_phi.AAC.2